MKTIPLSAELKAPRFLRNLPGWLCWKAEPNGDKKPLKVPYYANGKKRTQNGTDIDLAALTSFDNALAYAIKHGYTGVGFAPRSDFNITVLDFDNCIADDIQQKLLGTYVEYSPSGNGMHAFIHGNFGDHKSGTKDYGYGLDVFASKGYVTFTGNVTELAEITDSRDCITPPSTEILQLLTSRFRDKLFKPLYIGEYKKSSYVLSDEIIHRCLTFLPADADYETWCRIGMALHHATDGAAAGFDLWDEWSLGAPAKYNSTGYNQSKWDSFGRYTDRPVTAYSLIKLANDHGANIGPAVAPDSDFEPVSDEEVESIPRTYFKVVSDLEFCKNNAPVSWLIKGILPKATLGVIYGESGSGKSFLVLDMCAAIVRNIPWNGYKTKGANRRVLYVIAEGVSGFPNRLEAYRMKAGLEDQNIGIDIVQDKLLNLTKKGNTAKLINDFKILGQYDLIVIDTFAQVTPGMNESSSEDMGIALDNCKKLSAASGAMVLIVHHSGKDASKGMRGHSSALGASDAVFEITHAGDYRIFKIVKLKEGKEGEEFGFRLETKVVGFAPLDDDETEPDVIESCVVEFCDVVRQPPKIELKSNQKVVFDVLSDVTPGSWMTENNIIELCLEQLPREENARDLRKQNVKKALFSMVGRYIDQNDNGEYRAIL